MASHENVDRRIIYCLLCLKPSETISTHLARVCMKDKSPEERQAEVHRAKASTKLWTREGRIWDYKDICTWHPHGPCRRGLVKELERRGFFVLNRPEPADTEETMGPAAVAEASSTESSLASSPTPGPSEDPIGAEPEAEAGPSDPCWQRPQTSQYTNTLRARMQEENLYSKFPSETSLLIKFKDHLTHVLQFPNCQQEVDNVSRVLRYIQPTGDDISLDFLQNTNMVGDYFKQLRKVGQSPATRINYVKSLIRFIHFVNVQFAATDLNRAHQCKYFLDFLNLLRKPISKNHSQELCGKRHDEFVGPKKTVHSLQKVLREAKSDILGIYGCLLKGESVPEDQKTRYRYFCEAMLILGHFQRPGSVEGLAVIEWLKKRACNGRFVVAVKSHKTSNTQVAPFALTEEESALIEQYYLSIRPHHLKDAMDDDTSGFERLFVSQKGLPINSATNDLRRLHEMYNCPNVTSQEIRRAAETQGDSVLTDEQKTGLAHYMAHTDKVAKAHYRMRDPVSIVNTANILQLITQSSSDDSGEERASLKRSRPAPEADDFGRFRQMFPVTLAGNPPNKVTRTGAGFSMDRTLYDRWRSQQFKMRETHLLGAWTRRPPTTQKVQRLIQKEQWHANCPTSDHIMSKWQPPQKEEVETSTALMRLVHSQKWKYLAVVEPSPKAGEGKGVVTTKTFPKDSILCDYHGQLITGAEGRKRMAERDSEMGYSFFFKAGNEDLCVDAHNSRCPCHPDTETFGRLFNHSKKKPNVRPVACLMNFPEGARQVILFRALRDLNVNEELLFDYGVRKNSFSGEGSALTWLDD